MNRCIRSVSIALALLALSGVASAQEIVRPFPAAAKRATLKVIQAPEILLNGQPARLSPGARIRGTNNLLLLSGSLTGQQLVVNYVLDPVGLVHEVWVLNATEAQQAREGAVQPPNYVSDATTATGDVGGKVSTPASTTQP